MKISAMVSPLEQSFFCPFPQIVSPLGIVLIVYSSFLDFRPRICSCMSGHIAISRDGRLFS